MEKNLPSISFENLFTEDKFGKKLWLYHLGSKDYEKYQSVYETFGKNAALASPLSDEADKMGPCLNSYSPVGEALNEIKFHPSYQKLKELSYGAGVISQKYTGDLMDRDKKVRHLVGFSTSYYFAQTETGLFCPICMTDALGRVLEIHAQDNQVAQEVLKRLKSNDLNELWEGAMFLTERQGGSDVGANEVRAVQKNNSWELFGEKWFCSNANAGAILVLARIEGEQKKTSPGTKGLGLFLLTRDLPENNHKNWKVKRLKEKLGVRSMASAEIELCGAQAHLIGGLGEGFKMMTDMVNMSRIYNSVASLAIARRSILEAKRFAERRQAFGTPIENLPLYSLSLAELQAEFLALHFLVFESVKQMDHFDNGDKNAGSLLRTLTPLSKAISGKFSVFASAEGMELIGGNAYIEGHILPRLYRDAQVLPIWEGTTQIQSLDVLRVLSKEGAEPYFLRIEKALASEAHPEFKEKILSLKENLTKSLKDLQSNKTLEQQKGARKILESMGRLMSVSLMYEALEEVDLRESLSAALQVLLQRTYFTDPLASAGLSLLKTSALSSEDLEKAILESI